MRITPVAPTPSGSPAPRSTGSQPPRADRSFTAVLSERVPARPPPPARADSVPPATGKPPVASPVRAALERIVNAESKVDALLAAAARGKTFSPAELLALQAGVFRYSQTVEVVSRVADRLVGAIKQTMGTSV